MKKRVCAGELCPRAKLEVLVEGDGERRTESELASKCEELERILGQCRDQFQKLFHASPTLMIITTLEDGRIIDLNDTSASLSGFTREESIGRLSVECGFFANPADRVGMTEKLKKEGKIRNMKVRMRTKDGEIRTVLMSADPVTIDNVPCILSVSIDITAREQETEAVRQSEEKYRQLVENSIQGLAIIQDGRFAFCNSAFAAITGYSVEELLAIPAEDMGSIIHPDDRETMLRRHLDRIAGRPLPPRFEYRGIRKDGTEVWIEAFASVIQYNGRPAVQATYIDATDRKKAEKALRESEERFRLIAETIDEIFWIFDVEKQESVYISPAHERIWGTSPLRFVSAKKPVLDQVPREDWDAIAAMGEKMKAGEMLDFSHRVIRPDGSVRNLWTRGFPIREADGKVRRYVGVAQDVTERTRAEAALKDSMDYLNQIINCLGDPIFVKDEQHRLVLVNDALCALAGKTREVLLGEANNMPLPDHLVASILEQEQFTFETGRECVSEESIPDGQGRLHTMMTKKSLLTDKAGNKQIVGVLRDITEYKHLQEQFLQSQKMEAIGVLAGGVAHDFNNLLTVIKGYTEFLMEDFDSFDPRRRDLEQIARAAQQASSLTSQLLAFSRKQVLQPKVLDLNEALDEMSKMLRRLIGEDIQLEMTLQPGLDLINADPGQIQQIVMNLAVNARDAMPLGGKLKIETANVAFDEAVAGLFPAAAKGEFVMLLIHDNGVGMDAETQARIFEPFYTTKEKGKGTGLGLSTVYGIVKQSGGFLRVESEPGKGTTFRIYFPRTEGSTSSDQIQSKPYNGANGSETVLVVEDEPPVRELAIRILRSLGYNVLEAANGLEALRIAKEYQGKIHLVLTDAVMPGISGSVLVQRLETVRSGIKALYVSGYADNVIVHQGILDPNVAFLPKPFTMESLASKVREVLNS